MSSALKVRPSRGQPDGADAPPHASHVLSPGWDGGAARPAARPQGEPGYGLQAICIFPLLNPPLGPGIGRLWYVRCVKCPCPCWRDALVLFTAISHYVTHRYAYVHNPACRDTD